MWAGAEAYDHIMGRWSWKLSPKLIDFAEIEAGDRVLDIGCGTGSLTRALLQLRPGAKVVGVDSASSYVEFARQDVDNTDASFEQADAQNLSLDDDSFDKSLSLLVINFLPDACQAAKEMLRVTRPGGVAAAAVWDYDEGMQMFRVLWDTAIGIDPGAESEDDRNMPFCRPGELGKLWSDCGFERVREDGLVINMEFQNFGDYWQPFLSGEGPTAKYIGGMTPDNRRHLRDQLIAKLAQGRTDQPFTLQARAWAVRGNVPLS